MATSINKQILQYMNQTINNLKEAFAGESQASQKYLAFAKKAEKEGFRNIATLFHTAAQAERIHAEGHLGALDGIGTTAQNLAVAIEGETYEYTKMYPPMLSRRKQAGTRPSACLTMLPRLKPSMLSFTDSH